VPPGTWQVVRDGSAVGFTARHLLVSLVHGRFDDVEGLIVVATDVAGSSVAGRARAGSITTGDPVRDEHLRSPDFLDAATWPELSLTGHGVTEDAGRYRAAVSLTIRGITRPVAFDVTAELVEPADDGPPAPLRARFTARATVNRKDFGLRWNPAIEAGGILVGEEVHLEIDVLAEHTGTAAR
jgi:polyisoprenoid-binding protein YceI